jgi:hypothetical protein
VPRTNVVGTTPPPGSGTQRCAQVGARKHRTDSTTGPATTTSNSIDPRPLAALCADLVGSDICTADGIIARSYAPVLALCRRLIEAGIDPDRPLQVYRGDTLALTVRSIAEGARLAVEDNHLGHPRFVRRSGGAALPTRQNGAPATGPHRRAVNAIHAAAPNKP